MSEPKEVEIDFVMIPKDQAIHLVAIGNNRFSAITERLIEQLSKPNIDEVPAFRLPKGTGFPETKKFLFGVNFGLRRAGIDWRVKYVASKNLFVPVPKNNIKEKNKSKEGRLPRMGYGPITNEGKKMLDRILELTGKMFSIRPGDIWKFTFNKPVSPNLYAARCVSFGVANCFGIGMRQVAEHLHFKKGSGGEYYRGRTRFPKEVETIKKQIEAKQ